MSAAVTVTIAIPGMTGKRTLNWCPWRRTAQPAVPIAGAVNRAVMLTAGVGAVDVDPDVVWYVSDVSAPASGRYLAVPKVTGPVPFTALVEVDPLTLQPPAAALALRLVALEDTRPVLVDNVVRVPNPKATR